MLEEYGVLINLMVLVVLTFTLFWGVLGYLLSKKNIKKTEQRRLLEGVYNPLESAITVFKIEFKNDALDSEHQFKKFESACLDVKRYYGDLIDYDTTKYFKDLKTSSEEHTKLHSKENFENLAALMDVFHTHVSNKKKEIKKNHC